ncbi:ammonium transporter [Laceyella putida]|uniref:Ammonium transporter n=1 Tax=Laceyella putida TaxID=110101 RepID=A0ABW2RGY6_9BACL
MIVMNIELNTLWVLLATAMVVFMEGGFSLLEAGFVRAKNAVNVTMKVFVDLTFGTLAFYVIGFHLMFGEDVAGLIGKVFGAMPDQGPGGLPLAAYLLFQIAFAIAVASIISGAVAERMKFSAYMLVTVIVCGVLYPISGHWIWSEHGWLARLGMKDFAGSTAIHAMGGFAALALAQLLGPRQNRFNGENRSNREFAPSNLPLASAGAFILWFGWFGFNAGSTLSAGDARLSTIALNTFLAAAAGGASTILAYLIRKKPVDPGMVINGSLAGLVAITAGCAFVTETAAVIIGLIAGILVIFATDWVERLKIDDPVGAVAVHGFNGVLGTVAVGLFDIQAGWITTGQTRLLLVQLLGAVAVAAWGYLSAYAAGKLLQVSVGIRVSPEEEQRGLDLSIHGMAAYHAEESHAGVEERTEPAVQKQPQPVHANVLVSVQEGTSL